MPCRQALPGGFFSSQSGLKPRGSRDKVVGMVKKVLALAGCFLELVLVLGLFWSCTLFYGAPEPLLDQEITALELVFPQDMVDYLKERVFLDDNISLASCYYPLLQMVLIRTGFREASIHGLVMVHEFTHYYQDVYLKRPMTASEDFADYTIPEDLTVRLNIEAEAELVRTVVLNIMNSGNASAGQLAYLQHFMGLAPDIAGLRELGSRLHHRKLPPLPAPAP